MLQDPDLSVKSLAKGKQSSLLVCSFSDEEKIVL